MISVLFYGTPEIARICLAALIADPRFQVKGVVTQPDRPTGRKQLLTPSPVKLLATEHQIPVLQPERIKNSIGEFSTSVNALGPIDIAVVVAFGQILPEAALTLPRCGSLNLHASLLPRWRGAAPIQRSIMAGDRETGVCLMQMDVGLDTGAVFVAQAIPISASDTAATIHDQLALTGAALIVNNLPAIVAGELQSKPQSNHGATYAEKINDGDANINWNQSSDLVSCQIRGLSPRPGAYTFLEGKRIKLFECHTSSDPVHGAPGTLLSASPDGLTIACAPGSLTAAVVQVEGKTKVNVADFLKGNQLTTGLEFKRV